MPRWGEVVVDHVLMNVLSLHPSFPFLEAYPNSERLIKAIDFGRLAKVQAVVDADPDRLLSVRPASEGSGGQELTVWSTFRL